MQPVVQFRLRITRGAGIALGPGKIRLLEAIAETGSISSAARKLDMSYRRAWDLVDEMNRSLKQPVVETAVGGTRGGGTVVTESGRRVIELYRRIEEEAHAGSAKSLASLTRMLVQ
ncbi:MAG TPA: LysR family transcriptional regulator [Burkholderiaceae bacterium]|nr:LysR family transcriptional regulator [Burkholderiaceae bacterium]